MKKILLSIVLLLAVIVSVASCNKPEPTPPAETTPAETTPDSQQTTGGGTVETPKTVWETLQELSQQQYSKVKLNIKTVTGDVKLNASYTTEQRKAAAKKAWERRKAKQENV